MRISEEIDEKINMKAYYDNFVEKTREKLSKDKQLDFKVEIQQKLKSVNVFERNEKQNQIIIRQERNKVIQQMQQHVEKCPYVYCKMVFEQVLIYGIFAGSYKQDPVSFIGYKQYRDTKKTDCPYGSVLNENMMQTHRILKEQIYKELKSKVL